MKRMLRYGVFFAYVIIGIEGNAWAIEPVLSDELEYEAIVQKPEGFEDKVSPYILRDSASNCLVGTILTKYLVLRLGNFPYNNPNPAVRLRLHDQDMLGVIIEGCQEQDKPKPDIYTIVLEQNGQIILPRTVEPLYRHIKAASNGREPPIIYGLSHYELIKSSDTELLTSIMQWVKRHFETSKGWDEILQLRQTYVENIKRTGVYDGGGIYPPSLKEGTKAFFAYTDFDPKALTNIVYLAANGYQKRITVDFAKLK